MYSLIFNISLLFWLGLWLLQRSGAHHHVLLRQGHFVLHLYFLCVAHRAYAHFPVQEALDVVPNITALVAHYGPTRSAMVPPPKDMKSQLAHRAVCPHCVGHPACSGGPHLIVNIGEALRAA